MNKSDLREKFPKLKLSYCAIAFFSSVFQAFGMYNIHSISGVTEGGVLGATLLIEHWFKISPAISGFIMNAFCFLLGRKTLGKKFIAYSVVASLGFSMGYGFFEQFPRLWPELSAMPLVASISGALFIGIGAGFCVLVGAATSGDDALAMSINHMLSGKVKIQWIYFVSDFIILLLSLSYIPFNRIIYSFITVTLSGQIIGLIQNISLKGMSEVMVNDAEENESGET